MKPILDQAKRNQVIGILAVGGSRTLAAQFVDCHPRTIYNTAKADPDFAAEINRAETSPEYQLIRTVYMAGKDGVLHATKWALERIYPDRFRLRKPGTFSVDAIRQLMTELAGRLAEQAKSDDERRRVLETIANLGKEMVTSSQPFVEAAIPLLEEMAALADTSPSTDLPAEASDNSEPSPETNTTIPVSVKENQDVE